MVVNTVESLTIDLNKQSNVDKEPLLEAKKARVELQGQASTKNEAVRYQVKNVRNEADFLQGKVSEYEALLMSYAEEKAYLVSEIERLRIEFSSSSTEATFNEVKGGLLDGRINILSSANKGMSQILGERKTEGSSFMVGLENAIIN